MPMLKHHLVHWLRDAYAMEVQSIDMLERQCSQKQNDTALEKRLQFHLEETRDQAEKLRVCLEHLGSNTSGIKVGLGKLVGNMHAITSALGPDEMVKTAIIDTVFEQFEIGCYEALVVAAEEAGEDDVADVCRRILAQERQMEMWLEKHLPDITRGFLHQNRAKYHNQAALAARQPTGQTRI